MIRFIEPKHGRVDEWLSITGRGDMSDFGFFEKRADPVIVTYMLWPTLKCSWRLRNIVSWHNLFCQFSINRHLNIDKHKSQNGAD